MRYQISKGYKSFGANTVLDNITFEISGKEKVAIIGRNGCGKTTLLKIIAGIDELDSGEIHTEKSTTIGYLAQTTFADENRLVKEEFETIFEELHRVEVALNEVSDQLQYDHSEQLILTGW